MYSQLLSNIITRIDYEDFEDNSSNQHSDTAEETFCEDQANSDDDNLKTPEHSREDQYPSSQNTSTSSSRKRQRIQQNSDDYSDNYNNDNSRRGSSTIPSKYANTQQMEREEDNDKVVKTSSRSTRTSSSVKGTTVSRQKPYEENG
jgi:hypothetical protein